MKRKNIALITLVLGIGTLFSACNDYLDSDKYFEDRITIEKVFTSRIRSQQWLAYAYSFLKDENADVVGKEKETNSFTFADDMYYGDRDVNYDSKEADELSYNTFMQGEYDENDFNQGWTMCYKGIYQASVFIANIYRNTEMTEKERLDFKGQARFVRAYFYWLLLRRYGPVPIMPDEGVDYTLSYEEIATPRSSYEEVANYISSEMVQAAKEIQYTRRDGENIARPTKGACLATRALALAFAASPLANGNTDAYAKQLVDDKGRALLNADYQEEKWARAAAACKDVMQLGVYDLYHASFSTTDAAGDPATIVPADSTCPKRLANRLEKHRSLQVLPCFVQRRRCSRRQSRTDILAYRPKRHTHKPQHDVVCTPFHASRLRRMEHTWPYTEDGRRLLYERRCRLSRQRQ